MSQVYDWFNYDKMERLDWWWSCGGKLWGNCWTHCEENNALLTLLAGRWEGDRVIRYGCEGLDTPEDGRPFLKEIKDVFFEDRYYDSVDITGLFEETRGHPHDVYDENGDFAGEEPFEGPFELRLEWYRYVINVDRKQFFDRERTAVHRVGLDEVFRDDLFTVLCTPWGRYDMVGGERLESWFGEVLAASNERPGDEYEDITGVHWKYSVPTDLSDEEILAYVCEGAPDFDDDPKGWDRYVSGRLGDLIGKPSRV